MYIVVWVQYKSPQLKTKVVSCYGLTNYIFKKLKAKKELSKLQNFTMQKYNL
jgi:hypothetical protein